MVRVLLGALCISCVLALTACPGSTGSSNNGPSGDTKATFIVTYNGNGNTKGTVPVDSTKYTANQEATLLSGDLLVKEDGETRYQCAGWTLDAEGTGTLYQFGSKLKLVDASVTFYAKWAADSASSTMRTYGPGGTVNLSVELGTVPTHLYLSFTNTNLTTSRTLSKPTAKSLEGLDKVGIEPNINPASKQSNGKLVAVEAIKRMDIPPKTILLNQGSTQKKEKAASTVDSVGKTKTFYEYSTSTVPAVNIPSTCRYVSAEISTPVGNRTVCIWVANDCWNVGGTKTYKVTQAMVDELAKKFMVNGNSALYSLATNILGAEWGSINDTSVIPFDRNITILLYDIDGNNVPSASSGYVAGYYDPVNNFNFSKEYPFKYSNERIMFSLDAVMYAKPDASVWSIDDYYAQVAIGTLVNQIQHMVSFYQKLIVQDAGDFADVWVDQMCSMMLEDLLAEKLGLPGPRGTTIGAATEDGIKAGYLPYFTENWRRSLKVPEDTYYRLYDYGVGYAFGAYLLRNYGGAALLHHIVNSPYLGETAITAAISKTGMTRSVSSFGVLLSRWSIAVLGSKNTAMPAGYRYNTGDWMTTSYGGIDYKLGSINFRNYSPDLFLCTLTNLPQEIPATANAYAMTTNTTGTASYTVTLPADVMLSVYVGD